MFVVMFIYHNAGHTHSQAMFCLFGFRVFLLKVVLVFLSAGSAAVQGNVLSDIFSVHEQTELLRR